MTHCGAVAGEDALHISFECPALQPRRQQYAPLFSTNTALAYDHATTRVHMQDRKVWGDGIEQEPSYI